MTDIDDIYSDTIMALAAKISHTKRLDNPDATATANSKLCGSTIVVDIKLDERDRITDFGQDIKACLLGQVSASVVSNNIVGATVQELRDIATTMNNMLKSGGPPPVGRWKDLAILEPVKDYHTRHASTMLIFTALEKAFQEAEQHTPVR